MTTNTAPARPAAAPADGVPPERIGLRRRWMLRRHGRRDGRMRRPDPLRLVTPAGTPTRALLHAEFGSAAARAYAGYTEEAGPHRAALELVSVRLPQLRANLATAEALLTEAEAHRTPPGALPERLMGEHFQPEELVRARRRDEHAVRSAGPRRQRDAAHAELQRAEQEVAERESRIDEALRRAAHLVRRKRAICVREYALYAEALLRRHPEGELLRDLLDRTPPELPAWVAAAPGPAGKDDR